MQSKPYGCVIYPDRVCMSGPSCQVGFDCILALFKGNERSMPAGRE